MTSLDTTMNPHPSSNSVTEDELHALMDGRLAPAERAALQTRLATEPAAMATLADWQAQRVALRNLHRSLLDEPLPPALLASAQRAAGSRQQLDQWWRWGGTAASVVLAACAGWLSHEQWISMRPDTAQEMAAVQGSAQEFARQASVAHAVYAPDVLHPVEVSAAQPDHLVQWLSNRLDKQLVLPNLSTFGYQLVGGRLLPGDAGPRAQFMFQNPAGDRVTVYVGVLKESRPAETSSGGTPPLSFSADGPVPDVYWVDHGMGYALAGQLTQERLMQLARLVCDQT